MPYLTPNTIPDETVCYGVRIPNEPYLIAALMGAVSELFKVWNWEAFGEMTPQETADAMLPVYQSMAISRGSCMIGAIIPFATTTLPTGILLCDGSGYDRVDFPELYDKLDSVFITGADTFVVPDLRGLFVKGKSSDNIGDTGGASTVTLGIADIPSHDHLYSHHTPIPVTVGAGAPVVVYAPPDIPTLTSPTGGNGAHENKPPYMTFVYGIVAQ